MRKLPCSALPLVAVALFASTSMMGLAQDSRRGSDTQQQSTTADWATPPPGPALVQKGYKDGVEAAALDKAATRPIDPKVSHLYVHPPAKGADRDSYRAAFVAGYQAALQHGA